MMRKGTLLLMCAALCSPGGALALGLGDITVRSALNQPLNAEIELLAVRPGELEDAKVTLGTVEAFAQAGIERPFLLSQLRFAIEKRKNGTPYLKVFTEEAVQEPFLNYLIEVNWATGRLVREYTVLLDPPVFAGGSPPQIDVPKAVVEPSSPFVNPSSVPVTVPQDDVKSTTTDGITIRTEVIEGPLPKTSSPFVEDIGAEQGTSSAPQPASPFVNGAAPGDTGAAGESIDPAAQPSSPFSTEASPNYGPTSKGQGLWSIAKSLRSDASFSMEQMMVALLKVNPEAFIDDNINTLKANQTLRVPTPSEIGATSTDEAKSIVKQHDTQWADSSYRMAKIGAPAAPPATIPETTIPETTASAASISAESPAPTDQPPATAPTAPEASPATSDAQTDPGDPRLKLLTPVEGKKPEVVAEANPGALPNAPQDASATQPAPTGFANGTTAEELTTALALANEELETKKLENDEMRSRVNDLESQTTSMQRLITLKDEELANLQNKISELEQAKQAASATTPAAEAAAESGFIHELRSNPLVQGLLALVVIALVAVAWVIIRRRQMSAIVGQTPAAPVTIIHKTDMGDELAGGASASSTQPMAKPVEPDYLAEAEVYLSYKRYGQAEEMFKRALARTPGRHDIQLKLLKLHLETNNRVAFITQAEALHEALDGQGPLWAQAVAMGKEIYPEHPLFGGTPARRNELEQTYQDIKESAPASDPDWFANELTQDQSSRQGARFGEDALDGDNSETSDAWAPLAYPGASSTATGTNGTTRYGTGMAEFDLSDIRQELESGLTKASPTTKPGDDYKLDFDLEKEADDLARASTVSSRATGRNDDPDPGATPMSISDEVVIKLDLAKAYIEMGDAEGAQDILDEVIKDGNEGQRQQAKQLLQQAGV